jgi:hypothetical protein
MRELTARRTGVQVEYLYKEPLTATAAMQRAPTLKLSSATKTIIQ